MIKRTIYFGNSAYLSVKDRQLKIRTEDKQVKTLPIEDLGILEFDNPQITITNYALHKLTENNVVILICNVSHLPIGILSALESNTLHSKRIKTQIDISEPQRKSLHKQIIQSKIANQGKLLKKKGLNFQTLETRAKKVKSGDSTNQEGAAANFYWKNLFPLENFKRERFGIYPNNLLNYGYAILRGITARAIVSAGLHPSIGIFHKNQYNAYCLADDLMEPFRVFVDELVYNFIIEKKEPQELNKEIKSVLLNIPYVDVNINKEQHPLMLAVQMSVNSLQIFYANKTKKLICPSLID